MDLDSVSPIGLDSWTWETAVDGESVAGDTVWGHCNVLEFEPIFHDNSGIGNFIVVVGVGVKIAPDTSITSCVPRTRRSSGASGQVGRSLSSEYCSLTQSSGESPKPQYESVGLHREGESNELLLRDVNDSNDRGSRMNDTTIRVSGSMSVICTHLGHEEYHVPIATMQ